MWMYNYDIEIKKAVISESWISSIATKNPQRYSNMKVMKIGVICLEFVPQGQTI
uniref:Uncharacterized protein n=1 Tax=Octopus bimaculoides TaxID=37653 RepID=A0A0L8HQP1_OCTBM